MVVMVQIVENTMRDGNAERRLDRQRVPRHQAPPLLLGIFFFVEEREEREVIFFGQKRGRHLQTYPEGIHGIAFPSLPPTMAQS